MSKFTSFTICSYLIFQGRLLDAVNFELPQTLAKPAKALSQVRAAVFGSAGLGTKKNDKSGSDVHGRKQNCIYIGNPTKYQRPTSHEVKLQNHEILSYFG